MCGDVLLTCIDIIAARAAPKQFWPKTECQCEAKGTIGAHRYLNTVIRLETAKETWGFYINAKNADYTKPYSEDGGRTWIIDQIDIKETYCENTEACPTKDENGGGKQADWSLSDPNYVGEDFTSQVDNGEAAPPNEDGTKALVAGISSKRRLVRRGMRRGSLGASRLAF